GLAAAGSGRAAPAVAVVVLLPHAGKPLRGATETVTSVFPIPFALRAGFGLQAEIARRIGVSPQSLNKYWTGDRRPGAALLVRLADAVGCRWVLEANPEAP